MASHSVPFVPPPGNQVSTSPPAHAAAVTPSDSVALPALSRFIWVGGGPGNLAVIMAGDDTAVTLIAVPAGTMLELCVSKVMSTNTTSTNIVALW